MKSLLHCLATAALLFAGPVAAALPLDGARQLVVVVSEDWNSAQGELQAFSRHGAGWRREGAPFTVALGRSGSAWGLGLHPVPPDGPRKQEGDGRSPAGIFALGTAFGYAASAATALPWQAMRASSYCVDVAGSPYYNQIVDVDAVGAGAVAGATEPMRLDLHNDGDVRYQQGFVIAHNPRNLPGRGSCIFAHLWRSAGEATAGCTAMDPAHMRQLLAWLQPARQPRFILMPRAQYEHLRTAWKMPALASGSAGSHPNGRADPWSAVPRTALDPAERGSALPASANPGARADPWSAAPRTAPDPAEHGSALPASANPGGRADPWSAAPRTAPDPAERGSALPASANPGGRADPWSAAPRTALDPAERGSALPASVNPGGRADPWSAAPRTALDPAERGSALPASANPGVSAEHGSALPLERGA